MGIKQIIYSEAENNKQIDRDLIVHHALAIASKNITDIRQIEWRLKSCIK